MRKIFLIICLVLSATTRAEDILQVVPFEAQAGATSADGLSFSIEMNNESADIWAFQFDILLPEGMTLDNTGGLEPFELGERCPYTTGRGGSKTWKHTVQYSLLESGWYRVVVFTTDADRIDGSSGEVLRAYYLTDDNMQPGIYPIYVKGTVLTISGNSDIKPVESSSYCVVGESPLKNAASPCLSMLTGYIPSWVVESVSADLAENSAFTELDFSGADAFGATLTVNNKNAVCYVKQGSTCADNISGGNIVECGDANACTLLSLHDGEYDFSVSRSIACTEAAFDRVFKAGLWSTVCLPFAVSADKVAELNGAGVSIEELVGYDESEGVLTFAKVTEILPDRSYIIKCGSDYAPFESVTIDGLAATAVEETAVGAVSMQGVYSTTILNSDAATVYYVYNSADGNFVRVGSNCKVMPFRAYVKMTVTGNAPNVISVRTSEDGTTAIGQPAASDERLDAVFTLDGRKVNADALGKGVYVTGNKKFIIK